MATLTCTRLQLEMPTAIDDMSDRVSRAYEAEPDRIYVISREGRVLFRSGPGPDGFDPDELARFLRRTIDHRTSAAAVDLAQRPRSGSVIVSHLSQKLASSKPTLAEPVMPDLASDAWTQWLLGLGTAFSEPPITN